MFVKGYPLEGKTAPKNWRQKRQSSASGHKIKKKIKNRYNQSPHLTQDTNGKVTTSQLDITIECQEVSPLPAGDQKASINRRA